MKSVAQPSPAPKARLTGAPLVLVLLCSLAYFLDGLVHSVMGPLAPGIARSLALTRGELGPMFSANLVGQCIGLVVVPLLVGRLGHRTIVVVTMIGFGIAQAATGLATSRDSLILLRVVTGFFLGGALPSCMALVATNTPAARKGLAIGLLFTGYGLGAIVAGVVASIFTHEGAWRQAMFAIGVACIVAALAAWRWLVDAAAQHDAGSDDLDRRAVAIFAPRYLLGTLMLWVIFVAMLTINYCLNSWLPTLLTDVGRDPAFAALSISTFAAGGITATLVIGPLIDRFGAQRVLFLFLVLATIMLYVIGTQLQSASSALLLILLVAGGFFSLGAYGGVNVVLAEFYPDHLRAVGVGWTKSVGRIGTVIAPILIGLGLSAGVAETTVMSLFAVPAAVTTIALLIIGRSMRKAT